MTKRTKIIIAVLLVVILLIAAAVAFGLFDTQDPEEPSHSQLTGEVVTTEEATRPILAVMYNNAPEARPQSGLDSAGIVFETAAEGGITRYLALFQEDIPSDVGSIRSLRTNFLDWVMGFDASIVHVGGSAEALDLVEERDAKTLTQFEYPDPYYRTDDRQAPHNMFASTDELRQLQEDLGHDASQFSEIPRSEDNPSDNPQVETISVDFSGPDYATEYQYNSADNIYTRLLAGETHIDEATNEPITIKNVIVLQVTGDYPVDAIGSGSALVFKDGNVIEAQWQKDSYENRVQIFDGEDNEIQLNRGSTWISVLPSDKPIEY